MEKLEERADKASEAGSLRFVRDAAIVALKTPLDPSSGRADLRGVLTRAQQFRKVAFLTLADVTGSIQVKCSSDTLSEETWQVVKHLKQYARVAVSGTLFCTEKGQPTLLATGLSRIEALPRDWSQGLLAENFNLGSQFLLARLRARAAHFYRSRDFEEFEPEYLAAGPSPTEAESIHLVFPGWGASAHLVPSPMRQLLTSALIGVVPKAFAVGRCFSQAIRDGFTSAESLLVAVSEVPSSLEPLISLAQDSVEHIFNDITTLPQQPIDFTAWERRESLPSGVATRVEVPTVEITNGVKLQPTLSEPSTLKSFRIILPYGVTVVEGHCETIAPELVIGCFSIHLERMLRLMSELVSYKLHCEFSYGPDLAAGNAKSKERR